MEAKIVSLIIGAVISSDVAVAVIQHFIFAKRISKLEQKVVQDNETFRYRFHEQRKLETALVDTMEEVRRTLKLVDGWMADTEDKKVRKLLFSKLLNQDFLDDLQEKADLMSKVFRNNYILDEDIRAEAIVAVGSFHSATGLGSLIVFNSLNQIALDDKMLENWEKDFHNNYIEATQKLDAIRELVRKKIG